MQPRAHASHDTDMTITPITPIQSDKKPDDTITSASHDKKQAKARAKYILQDHESAEVLDTSPDEKLMEKVEQEIAEGPSESDLLDKNSPQE